MIYPTRLQATSIARPGGSARNPKRDGGAFRQLHLRMHSSFCSNPKGHTARRKRQFPPRARISLTCFPAILPSAHALPSAAHPGHPSPEKRKTLWTTSRQQGLRLRGTHWKPAFVMARALRGQVVAAHGQSQPRRLCALQARARFDHSSPCRHSLRARRASFNSASAFWCQAQNPARTRARATTTCPLVPATKSATVNAGFWSATQTLRATARAQMRRMCEPNTQQ